MEDKINLIIDTDPGVDDAIAIMYAIKSEKFNIQLAHTCLMMVYFYSITFSWNLHRRTLPCQFVWSAVLVFVSR